MRASQFLPSAVTLNAEIDKLSTDISLPMHIFNYAKAGNAPMAEALYARVRPNEALEAEMRACQGFRAGGFLNSEESFLQILTFMNKDFREAIVGGTQIVSIEPVGLPIPQEKKPFNTKELLKKAELIHAHMQAHNCSYTVAYNELFPSFLTRTWGFLTSGFNFDFGYGPVEDLRPKQGRN